MARANENALDTTIRHLKTFNERLTDQSAEVQAPEYQITIAQDGSGAIHDSATTLVRFATGRQLQDFLAMDLPSQIKAIRAGAI